MIVPIFCLRLAPGVHVHKIFRVTKTLSVCSTMLRRTWPCWMRLVNLMADVMYGR